MPLNLMHWAFKTHIVALEQNQFIATNRLLHLKVVLQRRSFPRLLTLLIFSIPTENRSFRTANGLEGDTRAAFDGFLLARTLFPLPIILSGNHPGVRHGPLSSQWVHAASLHQLLKDCEHHFVATPFFWSLILNGPN